MPRSFSFLALLWIGLQAFAVAADFNVSMNIEAHVWKNIVSEVKEGDRLLIETEQSELSTLHLGSYLGTGAFGRVFRLADKPTQMVKLNKEYSNATVVVPTFNSEVSSVFRNSFEGEQTELARLDGTLVLHPRVFQNIRNLVLVKEYISGVTFRQFFESWNTQSLEIKTRVIHQLSNLAREIHARGIDVGDPNPGNIILQEGTFAPYLIDPGRIVIGGDRDPRKVETPVEYIMHRAIPNQYALSALWVNLIEPESLMLFLELESLLASPQPRAVPVIEAMLRQLKFMAPGQVSVELNPEILIRQRDLLRVFVGHKVNASMMLVTRETNFIRRLCSKFFTQP